MDERGAAMAPAGSDANATHLRVAAGKAVLVIARTDAAAVPPELFVVGPGGYCSPRHRVPLNSRNEGSKCVSMARRATVLAYIARHVIGCCLIQDTRVRSALDDVASTFHSALPSGSAASCSASSW